MREVLAGGSGTLGIAVRQREDAVFGGVALSKPVVSMMLAVPDAEAAAAWYRDALGAKDLWNLGGVVGLAVDGAPFFLGEPESNGWASPMDRQLPTVRIEVFVDDPDAFVARAVAAGAGDSSYAMATHEMPWGKHRQGGFVDPFGHLWFVGDRSPLAPHL